MTITIIIGNTDNKLTQQQWSQFIDQTHTTIQKHTKTTHYHGTSPGNAPWQNAAWITQDTPTLPQLKKDLAQTALDWKQDSIALTQAPTQLITPQDK